MSSDSAAAAAAAEAPVAAAGTASSVSAEPVVGHPVVKATADTKVEDMTSADYYFDSYSHYGIHEEMLKDEVRTLAYRNALIHNAHLIRGKTVLDVGCGTGILCLFAAKAGAKHVYGIDCSGIIEQAKEIVAANGFADKITLIRGKVEEVELPCKVDVIVSEWMGYFLLYESMLDTVLVARDKWLAPGGIMLPDKATLYLTSIEDEEYKNEKINFWDEVYGFNMSCIKKLALSEPLVDTVQADAIVSNACPVLTIDIATVTKEQLDFKAPWSLTFQRDDFMHALIGYFDVQFTYSHKPLGFSTGPRAKYTHWKQTVFYVAEPVAVKEGETMSGEISVHRNAKNPRDLDIVLTTHFDGSVSTFHGTQEFRLR